jgi:type IV secretion system protein VirD4
VSKVDFILDEAASLGHMEAIDDAVDKYRGYGIRLQFYYQSMGQLKRCFPEGQDQTLLSNTTQVFFGVNDNTTADYVSARLGEGTIVVRSGGTSGGSSRQQSYGGQQQVSSGQSSNWSENWQQQVRKVLKPEEVMALDPRQAITCTPGVPPILTSLLRYYEEATPAANAKSGIRRFLNAFSTLVISAVLCATTLMAAAGLTKIAFDKLAAIPGGFEFSDIDSW